MLAGSADGSDDDAPEPREGEVPEAQRVSRMLGGVGTNDLASLKRYLDDGDSGIDALTKRELEIAGLVTDRMTNREIATALFLSDKTIESHIRNIFHKLGVSSRVDVARAVERERRGRDGARPA